jgi:hypothetical protein
MISSRCAVKLLYPTMVVESVAWVHSIYVLEIIHLNTKWPPVQNAGVAAAWSLLVLIVINALHS